LIAFTSSAFGSCSASPSVDSISSSFSSCDLHAHHMNECGMCVCENVLVRSTYRELSYIHAHFLCLQRDKHHKGRTTAPVTVAVNVQLYHKGRTTAPATVADNVQLCLTICWIPSSRKRRAHQPGKPALFFAIKTFCFRHSDCFITSEEHLSSHRAYFRCKRSKSGQQNCK
jgi:hypothetical protein